MKKKLLSRHVAMLVMALVPLLSPAVNTIIYNATYDFNELTLGTDTLGGVTYTTINYEGLFNGGDPGKPSLPIDYVKLSVPYNASNFTVTATLQNNVIQTLGNLDQLVYPCQPARMMNDTTPVVIVPPDSSVYFSSSYYPGQNAWVVDEGFLAGENHIVTIAVMPVSYMHNKTGAITTNKIKKSHTVRLTLSYDLSDNPAMSPIIRQDTTLRQEGYALTRSMVANPSNVLANAPIELSIDPMDIVNPNSGDGINGGGVDPPGQGISNDSIFPNIELDIAKKCAYLIVTTPELKHSLRRLAALKRQKGYTVKVVTMNDVMNDSIASLGDRFKQADGTYYVAYSDSAGSLRQYLKNAYRYWGTKYVLLVGSSIPYRWLHNSVVDFLSDNYYSDLNSDWRLPQADRHPELFVGRILAKNSPQIDNYTNKLYRYEMNPGNGDYSYLKRALFTEAHEFVDDLRELKDSLVTIYPTQNTMSEIDYQHYPLAHQIIDTINTNHYGFLCTLDHGAPSNIITYGYVSSNCQDGYHDMYSWLWAVDSVKVSHGAVSDDETGNGLNNLNNTDYPMIYYSPACSTMPFDKLDGYDIETNYGESFTTGKDYGGPVYIGYTRQVQRISALQIAAKFAGRIKSGFYMLGEADALSKIDPGSICYDASMVHGYLGDPSLEIWTDMPQQYQNVNISRTDNSVTISSIDINNTIVSCCNNDGIIIRKPATSNVVILSEMAPNASIMLYRHNCIPYIAPMALQNTTIKKSQYVVASDFTAGFSIDSNRTNGDVIIESGVNYEIEATGNVILSDGFIVKRGATFSVIPSTF